MTNAELIATIKKEIERQEKLSCYVRESPAYNEELKSLAAGKERLCWDLKYFLDTLPVQEGKEVDLEKETNVNLEDELERYARLHPFEEPGSYRNLASIAKHFYELGKNSK